MLKIVFDMDTTSKKIISILTFIVLSSVIISCNGEGETPVPELSISTSSITEGNVGITLLQVNITSSIPLDESTEINYSTSDGTAKSGTDYNQVIDGSIIIPAGSTSGLIDVEILTDEVMEFKEIFAININNTGNLQINTDKVDVTIIDDDDETYVIDRDEEGFITPATYPEMTLTWSDEFDGPSINTDDWTFELGDGCPNVCGWGNNELEDYTDNEENARIVDRKLIITAREGALPGEYTSARMITKDKQEFQYGRIDVRAKLPEGQGIWPAIWMLGANIDNVGWPSCGEIDIMELVGHHPQTSHGTAHYNDGGHTFIGGFYTITKKYSEEFHLFSIFWDEDNIKWYVDYNKFFELKYADVGNTYPFNNPFFFIFNIAVGGNWPGNPDETTIFPQEMHIDYIRVFQQE
jgi:beta-glucanase (GH16 family)